MAEHATRGQGGACRAIQGESGADVRTIVRVIVEERTKAQKRRPIPDDVEVALVAISQVGGPPGKSDSYVGDVRKMRRGFIGISKDPQKQQDFRQLLTENLKQIDRASLNRIGVLTDATLFFAR